MSRDRPVQPIIGEAPAFLEMLEHVSRAAPLSKPVLVVGERGTGKELIASRLHFLSRRWEQPLVKVNCAALTESILESELFGHEAGAFTGAIKAHMGHFERADGGTLVLDELASISLRVQEKILRVIEYGELQRVGGERFNSELAFFLLVAEDTMFWLYSWFWGFDDWVPGQVDSSVPAGFFPQAKCQLGAPKGKATRKVGTWTYTRQYEHASVFVDLNNRTASSVTFTGAC